MTARGSALPPFPRTTGDPLHSPLSSLRAKRIWIFPPASPNVHKAGKRNGFCEFIFFYSSFDFEIVIHNPFFPLEIVIFSPSFAP